MNVLPITWKMRLNTHDTAPTYDDHSDKVKDLFASNNPKSSFKKLITSKNIVLLTKSSVGVKLKV